MSKAAQDAILRAKATGELPHEFLLRLARGEKLPGEKTKPDMETRIAAARAAAPFFAPKLAYSEVDNSNPNDPKNLTDEELEARIKEDEAMLELIRKAQVRSKTGKAKKSTRPR